VFSAVRSDQFKQRHVQKSRCKSEDVLSKSKKAINELNAKKLGLLFDLIIEVDDTSRHAILLLKCKEMNFGRYVGAEEKVMQQRYGSCNGFEV